MVSTRAQRAATRASQKALTPKQGANSTATKITKGKRGVGKALQKPKAVGRRTNTAAAKKSPKKRGTLATAAASQAKKRALKAKKADTARASLPYERQASIAKMREMERVLQEAHAPGFVVGVDEAGRGPLAGPVVAAACHVPLHLEADWLAEYVRSAQSHFQLELI
jgi:hypothetical protein